MKPHITREVIQHALPARQDGRRHLLLYGHRHADTLTRHIDDLRAVIDSVKARRPFSVVAMVVLPEHLHAIWRLPPGDADYRCVGR